MRKELITAARDVVAHLEPAEATLGQALIDNAELIARLGRARAKLNISAAFGHDIMLSLNEASRDILAGLSKTLAAHRDLTAIRDRFNLTVTDTGGAVFKDGEGGDQLWSPSGAHLSVVTDSTVSDAVAA